MTLNGGQGVSERVSRSICSENTRTSPDNLQTQSRRPVLSVGVDLAGRPRGRSQASDLGGLREGRLQHVPTAIPPEGLLLVTRK